MDIGQSENTKFSLSNFLQVKSDSKIICYGFTEDFHQVFLNVNHIEFEEINFLKIDNYFFSLNINKQKKSFFDNNYFIFYKGFLAAFPIIDANKSVTKNFLITLLSRLRLLNLFKRSFIFSFYKYLNISFLFILRKFGFLNFKIFYPINYDLKNFSLEFKRFPDFKKFYK